MKIGVDIGRVLVDNDTDTGRSIFAADYLAPPEVAGAAAGVARLVAGLGAGGVHLVSKCGERVEARTREWLHARDFFGRTGLDPANLHFCRRRPDKRPIAEALGLTAFVDDRWTVLQHLLALDAGRARLWLFRPDDAERRKWAAAPSAQRERAVVVQGWDEVVV